MENTTIHTTRSRDLNGVTIEIDAEATGRHVSILAIRNGVADAEPWYRDDLDHDVTRADLDRLADEAMADALGIER